MYEAFSDARLELGPGASLAKIAYFVTGLGIMSKSGKRWSKQTISDVIFIDTVQRESIAHALERIRPHYTFDPPELEKWESSLAAELVEAETIGHEIRRRLGMYAGD